MDGRKLSNVMGAPVDPKSIASRMAELLKGHKEWLTSELAHHLQTSVGTVHSALARHQKRLNIQHRRFYNGQAMVKSYWIPA